MFFAIFVSETPIEWAENSIDRDESQFSVEKLNWAGFFS